MELQIGEVSYTHTMIASSNCGHPTTEKVIILYFLSIIYSSTGTRIFSTTTIYSVVCIHECFILNEIFVMPHTEGVIESFVLKHIKVTYDRGNNSVWYQLGCKHCTGAVEIERNDNLLLRNWDTNIFQRVEMFQKQKLL